MVIFKYLINLKNKPKEVKMYDKKIVYKQIINSMEQEKIDKKQVSLEEKIIKLF